MSVTASYKKRKHRYVVTFAFTNVDSSPGPLQLAADFNGWVPDDPDFQIEPKRGGKGYKKFVLDLPPGRYEFKFYRPGDETWLDPLEHPELYDNEHYDGDVTNVHGSRNGVLVLTDPQSDTGRG